MKQLRIPLSKTGGNTKTGIGTRKVFKRKLAKKAVTKEPKILPVSYCCGQGHNCRGKGNLAGCLNSCPNCACTKGAKKVAEHYIAEGYTHTYAPGGRVLRPLTDWPIKCRPNCQWDN